MFLMSDDARNPGPTQPRGGEPPAPEQPAESLPASEKSTVTAQPGVGKASRIGPYRLIQKAGEGGMGEVWHAEQTEPIRRRVALKIIKQGMDTRQVIARFEAERQALALMNHPCVAKVFDAGTTPEGRPYFVMEYVQGLPITEHCDRHKLSTNERLALFDQVCEGVQHAHHKAIIHRDLKPSNVLVTMQEGKAVPKIIDFGVAKATAHRLTEESLFTEMGVLIGTPEYMSPEQADLTAQDVDTRTDVYSLGVMLYELLVGALPFEPKELRSAGLDGIRQMIREVEPPKPSMRLSTLAGDRSTDSARHRRVDVSTLRRQLTGDLDWITMKALEKDRQRRYGSPAELAADIGRHLTHEPVVAGPPSTAYRAGKFVRRHRFGVAVAASGVMLLAGFAVVVTVQAARIAREAEAKERVSEFLKELYQLSDPSEAKGKSVTARELLDRGAAQLRAMPTKDPEIRAELMATMGTVYRNLGLYAQAEPLLHEVLETRRRTLGAEDPQTLRAAGDLGRLWLDQGRSKEGEDSLKATLQTQKRVLGPEHHDTLRSMNNLAVAFLSQGRYQEAKALDREVLEIGKRVLGPEHPDTLKSMHNLANAYFSQGSYQESETLDREVLEITKRVLGPEHPDTLRSMTNLSVDYAKQGRYQESETLNREVLEISKRILGPEHPDTLRSMTNLSVEYARQGRYQEAEALDREGLEISKRILGPEHPDTLVSMNNLAYDYSNQSRYQEAEALLQAVLEIYNRTLGPEHPDTLWSTTSLALTLAAERRYNEAEALHRQVHKIRSRVLGRRHPDTLASVYNLGCTAALRGDRAGALGYLREAVDQGFSKPWVMEADSDLASLHGDPEFEAILAAARKNLERASATK